jgi:hypothetical protein
MKEKRDRKRKKKVNTRKGKRSKPEKHQWTAVSTRESLGKTRTKLNRRERYSPIEVIQRIATK